MTALADDLDLLLDADADAVRAWERSHYDELTEGYGTRVVLFGAGGLGRETLRGLRTVGVEPWAFADNNRRLWGQRVDGLVVLPPHDAARRFGEGATFVVSVFTPGPGNRFVQVRDQLQALGCCRVVPFAALAWKHPDLFLPNYCIDLPHKVLGAGEAVREAADLWADDLSRREFLAQLRWRRLLDFDVFSDPDGGETYFPADLLAPRPDEFFVDCGAFDGDTLRAFVDWTGGRFASALAFEPDPANFGKLTAWAAALPEALRGRVVVCPAAAGSRRQKLRYAATGTMAAAVAGDGGVEIDCVALDEVLAGRAPTFVKMDIEGAEPDALAGAAGCIARHRPVLAVCAYHRQDHLWRIPLQVRSLCGEGYDLYLRRHGEQTGEVVCFAVPQGRPDNAACGLAGACR
jgi:FkbM family methyltransferase